MTGIAWDLFNSHLILQLPRRLALVQKATAEILSDAKHAKLKNIVQPNGLNVIDSRQFMASFKAGHKPSKTILCFE